MLLEKIRSPILFQGEKKENEYFEGWYFKHVSPDEKKAVSFIPGISLVKNDSHSFVQYIYVNLGEDDKKIISTGYIKYPIEDFKFDNHPFQIRIVDHVFTESEVSIQIKDPRFVIEGALKLGPLHPIRQTIRMPNIMGYFAYLPIMECYHGVISMNHTVHGSLRINGEEIGFENGNGYIEKDWGTSFPKKYVWIQCNNFKNKNISLFCSLADIPFIKRSFQGFICNLVIDQKEYRFATYNHSKLELDSLTDEGITLLLESSIAKLTIQASLKNTGQLIAPQKGKMQEIIKEGLFGAVKICFYDKKNKVTTESEGNMAGIEIYGF